MSGGIRTRDTDRFAGEVALACDRFGLQFDSWLRRGAGARYLARVKDAEGRLYVLKSAAGRSAFGEGEANALRTWNDSGVTVRLEAELDPGLLLLEYVDGGSLWTTSDHGLSRAEDAGRLARELHRPAPPGTPALSTWAVWRWQRYAASNRRLEPRFRAHVIESLERMLEAGEREALLVHGDFQPFNMMVRDGRLLALDPTGLCGCAAVDIARFGVFLRGTDRAFTTMRVAAGYGTCPPGLPDAFAFIALTQVGYLHMVEEPLEDWPQLAERIVEDGGAERLLREAGASLEAGKARPMQL